MCFQCTLTRLPVREEGVTFRAGTEIGAGDVFTAERAAVVPERTFIHICATQTQEHTLLFITLFSYDYTFQS